MNASAEKPATTRPVSVSRRYPDAPMVGVAAVVINTHGQMLLVKRGRPPRKGDWGLPGGLLDLGERLAAGAKREVLEETGVECVVHDVVGTFEPLQVDEQGRIEYHYIVIDFWASYVDGEPVAQDDADDVAWVSLQEIDTYVQNAETRQILRAAHAAWLEHPIP